MKKEFPTFEEAEEYWKELDAQEGRVIRCPLMNASCVTNCASFQKVYITQGMHQIWLDDDDFEEQLQAAYAEGYNPETNTNQMIYQVYIVAGHRCGNKSVNEVEDWL